MENGIVGKIRSGKIAFTDLEYDDATRKDVIEAALDVDVNNFQYVSEMNKELAAENYFSKTYNEAKEENKSKYENIYDMIDMTIDRISNIFVICKDESFEENGEIVAQGLNLIANLCSFMQNDVREFALNENGEIDKDVRIIGERVYEATKKEAQSVYGRILDEDKRKNIKESLEFCAKFDYDLNNASIIEK